MADYDFSTLGSEDLEELVCDLLNAEVPTGSPVRYRTFRAGKDKGIDILYSTSTKPYAHVGQVKHYYRTGVAGLLKDLETKEVDKVKKLKPQKYILATSVDLNTANILSIKGFFSPYLRSIQDVYGKKDLNRLIEKHDHVLEAHYKLWFSDTSIIKKILDSGLNFRSADFQEHELTRRLRLYVKTQMLQKAREALDKNNFVIITGNPGVGKTTLAEMLTYQYIMEGYKLIYIYDDIKEAEGLLNLDEEAKQIIYFDDFLGSNTAEINRAQGSESALLSIIRRIKRSKNKKLVFTTRSFIFNKVQEQSERMKSARINLAEAVCGLSDYDQSMKEKVLFNHIDEGTISVDLKEVLLRPEVSGFIIAHANFNPRSVEFITAEETVGDIKPNMFEAYIRKNFDNPERIWKHAYEQQIDEIDRLLLSTLLTFDGNVDVKVLRQALEVRLEQEQSKGLRVPVRAFEASLAKLNKSFLQVKGGKVGFINPSVRDFMLHFIKSDPMEVKRMLAAVESAGQFSDTLLGMVKENGINFPAPLAARLLAGYEDFLRLETHDADMIKLALVMYDHVHGKEKENTIIEIIQDISDWEALYEDYSLNRQFMRFVDVTRNNEKIQAALAEQTAEIMNELITGESDPENAVDLLEKLTSAFRIDFMDFDSAIVKQHLVQIFDEYIATEVENLRDYILDPGEAYEKEADVKKLNQRINDLGLDLEIDMDEFNADWDEISIDNEFRRLMEKEDRD